MPTYEYQCVNCNHRFEQFQNMTAFPLLHCPRCGGPLRRLIGGGAGGLRRGRRRPASGAHPEDP